MATATKSIDPTILDDNIANLYVSDLLYHALLAAGEPVKASEAAKHSTNPAVDMRLARVVLATQPTRFTSIERKWTLWSRFADPKRSFERNLEEVLSAAWGPLSVESLAREMGAIYNKSAETMEEILPRTLKSSEKFFVTKGGLYGLNRWLLDISGDSEADVRFDNYLKEHDVLPFSNVSISASDIDGIVALLDKTDAPVLNKVLQYLVWQNSPETFDPLAFFTNMLNDSRTEILSTGYWIGPKAVTKLSQFFPVIAEKEVDEHGDSTQLEAATPLIITVEEREQLISTVANEAKTSRAIDLLESIFEVSVDDSTYAADLETVLEALKSDERVIWVGADRFLPAGSVPDYVFTTPESLHIPVTHYTDTEGNELDLLLEDDGFDGGLQRESHSPLAQDAGDEEPAYTPDADPPATARCVLKFHHKEIGTFPLSQLPPGFFPIDANILQVELALPSGQRVQLWVNNEARIVYGLIDWYNTLPVDSGAVFYLERQTADKFVLTYGEETEPAMFISRNRVNELLELGRRAEDEEMPTFEVIREIMEHYRKGIEFITLLTEVNISRRTTRRMVASILSAYHCYFQRGGAWVFDAKKQSQGFDKSKRKYLKK